MRARVLRAGGWVALTALAVAVGLLLGVVLIVVAFPVFDQSGAISVIATPAPSAAPAPSTSPDLLMGGAVIPATAECAGCHASGGAIGLRSIPVMAHPLEGWGKCTSCHAPARLVDTAPGHSGIHATECTICHKPGDLPAPLSRPHRDNQNVACLSCHGSTAPLPTDMTHRKEATCWLCHRLPTIEPPVPAHDTAQGETDCLTCHKAGGKAGTLPTDHVERPATLCLKCHEVTLGMTPGGSPGLQVWPAPSGTPRP
jgi:hypothetical protein